MQSQVEALSRERGERTGLACSLARSLACSLAVACGATDRISLESPSNALSIMSGGIGTDTIQARLDAPLIVEVRVRAAHRAGVAVQFKALPPDDPKRSSENTALIGRIGEDQLAPTFSATTEVYGSVSVGIALGTVAQSARVVASVPELGVVDTARYVVQPGAAVRLIIPVRDTTLLPNGRYVLGAWAADRYGNRRIRPPIFTSLDTLSSVDAAGTVQVGSTLGRGQIEIRSGPLADTVGFAVVPP